MFCGRCGKEISADSTFCPYCGSQQTPPVMEQQPSVAQNTIAKPKSKLPIIIIAIAVLFVLLIGGGVFALSGFFSTNPVSRALYEGSENLFYDVSSGTIDVSFNVLTSESDLPGPGSASVALKWQLGDDLKHSTVYAKIEDGAGVVLKNNTFAAYSKFEGETMYYGYTYTAVDDINQAFKELYGVDIDLNLIVKNGHFDQDYIALISQQVADALQTMSSDYDDPDIQDSISRLDDIKVQKYQDFVSEFFTEECAQESVWKTFIEDLEVDIDGGSTTYKFDLSLSGLLGTFNTYLSNAASTDDDFALLANETAELRDQLKEALDSEDTPPINIEISTKNNVLNSLVIAANGTDDSIVIALYVDNINDTDLNSMPELDNILSSASSYSEPKNDLTYF